MAQPGNAQELIEAALEGIHHGAQHPEAENGAAVPVVQLNVVNHVAHAVQNPGLPIDPVWEPPRTYTPDYRGLSFEGTASAERPYAVPLGTWLKNFRAWTSMIDNLHLALDLGYAPDGSLLEDVDPMPGNPRDVFRNTYLCQAFASRLTPSLYDEIKGLSSAAQMFHYLVEVHLHACVWGLTVVRSICIYLEVGQQQD